MIIGVDFDGTCVTHEFPNVGRSIGAEKVLKDLINKGHKIILFTMRSDYREKDIDVLTPAVEWFNKNGIELYGINENPHQHTWTKSPKPFCHLYIDDAALGAPLIYNNVDKPFIDWNKVRELLVEKSLLDNKNDNDNDNMGYY